MTTKVTIDAHAGWPILVGFLRGEPNDTKRITDEIVPAGEKRDFYLHSGLKIVHIEELPRNDQS